MQCVILAAGEGLRMRPLTLNQPKPLLKVNGKPLLEHLLNALPLNVDEVIVVVGYLGQQIVDYFGKTFNGRKMKYVWQARAEGTYNALALCKGLLKEEPFLMLYADDLFDQKSLLELVSSGELGILVAQHENLQKFGVVELDEKGFVTQIEEKPVHPKSNLVNCGPLVLTPRIFDYPPTIHSNGEYYLTTAVSEMAKQFPFRAVHTRTWIPIGYPADIETAERALREKKID